MLKKIIYSIFFALAFLLPIQNVISQFLINNLSVSEIWLFWKEFLLIILSIFFLKEIFWKNSQIKKSLVIIALYFSLILIVTVSSFYNQIDLYQFILGFRFELFWLGFFALTLAFIGSSNFSKYLDIKKYLQYGLYSGFFLIIILVFSSLVFGQENVLSKLGFEYNSHSDEIGIFISSPICNQVDATSAICRISGGFSSPNHFAGYLLLIIPVFLVSLFRSQKYSPKFWLNLLFLALAFFFVILTVSRFAWIALFIILSFIFIILAYKNLHFLEKFTKQVKAALILTLILPVAFIGILFNVSPQKIQQLNLPEYIYKPASSDEHYRLTNASIDILKKHSQVLLFGYGLGQSGPANKPIYTEPGKTQIILQNHDIAQKYDIHFTRLAIPENWFLQVWLNGGIFYLGFYIILISLAFRNFGKELKNFTKDKINYANIFFGLGFFGIIIGNLFLHIWENQTVAIYWSLIYLLWSLQTWED